MDSNTDEALEALQRAVYCDQQFALGHYVLADVYASIGHRQKALRHWRSALQALEHHDSEYILPFSDGLTVEMLNGLIAYRLK